MPTINFSGKKVLVLGLGLNEGGVGSAKFFAQNGAEVRVTDLKSAEALKPSLDQLKDFQNITYIPGEHRFEDIDWADLVIKNPAIKPGNKYVEYALEKGKQVEQDMGIFLQYVNPDQLIGITGTKGKSTTSSLIYEILKRAEKKVILAGNIGKSVLDSLLLIEDDTLVVLELSSFQLESFEKHHVSPKWAVITNIYPDHLNYYKSMDEYIQAKRIIGKNQSNTDYLFINKDNEAINNPQFLSELKGQQIFYSATDLPSDLKTNLLGVHNKSNLAAALSVGKAMNIKSEFIFEALSNFKGVPFRMELVWEGNGIKIYNDTTATGPDASIQSLKTFPNCILIAGGMNKNMQYGEYANVVDTFAKKVFFLEGDSTEQIKSLMKSQELIAGTYDNFEEILNEVKKIAKPNDVILFSPGATSFNLFQNEFDRGRKFNQAVQKVFN